MHISTHWVLSAVELLVIGYNCRFSQVMPLCIPISSIWGFPMLNNLTNPWWCLPVCFSHSGVSADVPHCGSLLYPDDEWCWPLWGHLALPFDEIPIQISRSYFFFFWLVQRLIYRISFIYWFVWVIYIYSEPQPDTYIANGLLLLCGMPFYYRNGAF